ncbi:MAG: GTPase Era [Chloroflexi bacterium]|nr:GTPase Era [Anaerolineaceae bacterium]NMB87603.1 GTPase Era [Chloroflexota bacterium]
MEQDGKAYKAGFVAVIGRPNVGKSTLMNGLLGQKVAAVSPRPQTTRRKQLGILTLKNAQIVFMDTPGLHKAHHKLGEYMNEVALATLEDADVLVWMVDVSEAPNEEDQLIATRLAAVKRLPPVLLALNKLDALAGRPAAEPGRAYQDLLPQGEPFYLSATTGKGRDELLQRIVGLLPAGQPYYDEEQVTDYYEREIAAELVREAALLHLRDEVPHSIAVRIDEFTERGDSGAFIAATLFVERESHKGIVIGKGGEMLKKIGSTARQEIEGMSGRKVYLELRVKVNKNWRNDPEALKLLGYTQEPE